MFVQCHKVNTKCMPVWNVPFVGTFTVDKLLFNLGQKSCFGVWYPLPVYKYPNLKIFLRTALWLQRVFESGFIIKFETVWVIFIQYYSLSVYVWQIIPQRQVFIFMLYFTTQKIKRFQTLPLAIYSCTTMFVIYRPCWFKIGDMN